MRPLLGLGVSLCLGLGLALGLGACEGGVGGSCYDESTDFQAPETPDCNLDAPCPTVRHDTESCETFPEPTEPDVYDPDAGACIVASLGAGEVARYSINLCTGTLQTTSIRLQSYGDGTVLHTSSEMIDSPAGGRSTWRALPDTAYFDACDTSDVDAFLACIDGILDQACQGGEPACP